MRKLLHPLFRVAEAHFGEQGQHLIVALGPGYLLMQAQDFTHLRTDRFHRIKGVTRVLRHQADARPAQAVEPSG